jgi:hypothetical protein
VQLESAMNLLTWGEEPETRGDKYPCSAFRWALLTEADSARLTLAIAHQHRWKSTGEWHTAHWRFYGLSLARKFHAGIDHVWYDGPHCSLALGFLYILWSGNPLTGWCAKCEPTGC